LHGLRRIVLKIKSNSLEGTTMLQATHDAASRQEATGNRDVVASHATRVTD
jgi:hypothetical protein